MNKTNKTLLDMRRKSAAEANELDKSKQEEKEENLKRQTGKGYQVHYSEKNNLVCFEPTTRRKKML